MSFCLFPIRNPVSGDFGLDYKLILNSSILFNFHILEEHANHYIILCSIKLTSKTCIAVVEIMQKCTRVSENLVQLFDLYTFNKYL